MELDITSNPLVAEMALVLAIALVLSQALGPVISRMIEAIKPTGLIPDNWSGVFAIVLSAVLGSIFGLLGMFGAETTENSWRFVIYGFIAGILGPGAGAIQSAQVRTGIETRKILKDEEVKAEETKTETPLVNNYATPQWDQAAADVEVADVSPAYWKERERDRLEDETALYEASLGTAAKVTEEDEVMWQDPDAGAMTKSMLESRAGLV